MKLQEARKKTIYSQSELAKAAKINVKTLQHYEQGINNFDHARIDSILRVALTLECDIKNLIESEEIIQLIESYEEWKRKNEAPTNERTAEDIPK